MRIMFTLVLLQIAHFLGHMDKGFFDFCFFAFVMILAGAEDIKAWRK